MDRLWAPWRLSYVTAAPAPATECIFCDAQTGRQADLVLFRGQHCFVILNLYPYNNGHLMVVPNRHLCALEALRADEQVEMMTLARVSEMALNEAYRPHGINVGINLGKAAGAGIENHLHMHFVPRWSGDTNFMTAVGETRVLPEDLAASVSRLKPIFDRLAQG
jgi:ATP adenylyltransferase